MPNLMELFLFLYLQPTLCKLGLKNDFLEYFKIFLSYDFPDPLLLSMEPLPMLNKSFGQCSHPWFYFRLDASRAIFIILSIIITIIIMIIIIIIAIIIIKFIIIRFISNMIIVIIILDISVCISSSDADISEHQVSVEDGISLADQLEFDFFQVSAKTGERVRMLSGNIFSGECATL